MKNKILLPLIFTCLKFNLYAQKDDGRTITIPVIFHILYIDDNADNGMSDGVKNSKTGNSTTHLPKEKIQAELDQLDKDFRQLNDISKVISEYKSVVGNAKIHFTLRNIIYVKTNRISILRLSNSERLHKISPMQNNDSCLNVYISVLKVSGGGSEGVTNVPSRSLPESDAVNLNYSWVGLGYHLLSHEVGHWLGLWHIDDEQQLDSTLITDIPVQTGLTDIPCVLCTIPSVEVMQKQRSQFSKPNTNNFMDYSGCRAMFSLKQCSYMRNLIIRLRPVIWNNSVAAKH